MGWVGGRGLLVFVSIAVDELNADLLGEGELHLVASGGSQLGDALGNRDGGILDLWDNDALLLREIGTGDTWEGDWLVNAGLNGLWVGDGHVHIDRGNNGHIVLGGLGDLVAVLLAVSSVSVSSVSVSSISGLADGHHLGVLFLLAEIC